MLDGYDLLIPGPTQLHPDVLAEMARPMVPHYGADWTAYYSETIEHLRRIFGTSGPIFAIPGSGSAGLDAVIGSAIGPNDRLLVLSNGFFGERIAEIAGSHHSSTVIQRLPIDRPLQVDDLEAALTRVGGITAVMVVHSESSSGLLNPIKDLGRVCQDRDLLFIVDAISSLGGIELSMQTMHIDVCISASQKCLEGPPGLGLVAVAPAAWDRIKEHKTRGWYLNLRTWQQYAEDWADWHPYPITMAVPAFRALRVGLERVLQEGLEARWKRHGDMSAWIVDQTKSLGCSPVFPPEQASPTVVALRPPESLNVHELIASLREKHGILVAGGMGEYKGVAFRIGNMGMQATQDCMRPLIEALGSEIICGRSL